MIMPPFARIAPLLCCLALAVGCATSRPAEEPAPTTATASEKTASDEVAESRAETTTGEDEGARAASSDGLDARLTGFEYPYPVETLKVRAQDQELEMAYMDVAPTADPNGRTVLLLHGKNFSGAYWATTIEALAAQGFRVIAPDQVGFGKSSKPRHFQFSFHQLAELTAGLLDAAGVKRASVVGHSMGGMLATRFALMYPQRTERLALVNPIGLEDWKRLVPYQAVHGWYQQELDKTAQGIKAYMTKSYFDGQWKPEYEPLLAIQARWAEGPDHELTSWVSALTYDMIFTQPVVHEFGDVTVPTLLIIGQRDRTALGKGQVTPEVAKTLGDYPALGKAAAATIPKAELVEMDGIGHVPQYEDFPTYIAALSAFLEE